ncbi:hypothetical protein LOTGIDRAFT_228870 [Lottia gigantea]|uniref:Major facilitator superfamily (MFS) profile domain-containing protein n=1 Tax=Lottia gigantea TaxID=225164 RepID=V4A8Y4_LOTGI|nr:hypothetical protein LOTGIDRAFT_228870 [Lottia gigantea]ESO91510.1 hypothetical protein LOTGIDRAFT_228870 [Lottia gigantea]
MSLRIRQILIFCLGWLAYASTYLLRKPLGVIKADLESGLSMSKTQLGWLDTALLLPYAVMQMLLGHIGDRFGARYTLGISLLCAGFSMITFGTWSSFPVFSLLLFINGAAQSQCWPNCTKILLSWFSDSIRNSVFGMYGTCAFSGGIIGTVSAVYFQSTYGWRFVFIAPSIIAIVLGLLVLLFYKEASEAHISIPGNESSRKSMQGSGEIDKTEMPSIIGMWRMPMVAEVAIAVFCVKVVRYCMYMWLPLYLLRQLNYTKTQAGIFSTVFDVGGVAGSAAIGFFIDRFFPGRSIMGNALSIFFSTIFLILFNLTCTWGIALNCIFMFFTGAFCSGPDVLLGGSIAAEIGELTNKKAAVATVGLINGFGSVGTFIEGPVIGFVATHFGWSGMFYFMILLCFCGAVVTYRAGRIHAIMLAKTPNIVPQV